MSWPLFWQIVVWTAIISYFGLGVAIIFGGFFDAIKMFRRLEVEHAEGQMTNDEARMTNQ